MKTISKHRLTINKNKIEKEEKVDERVVADSVADNLVEDGKYLEKEGIKDLSAGIHTREIWREEKKSKKDDKKK